VDMKAVERDPWRFKGLHGSPVRPRPRCIYEADRIDRPWNGGADQYVATATVIRRLLR